MNKIYFLLAMAIAATTFQACEKDEVEDPINQQAPELPPLESFIMPFTGFEELDTSGITSDDAIEPRSVPQGFQNWVHSWINVAVWNTILGVNMALPVASFAESFNHQGQYVGDGVFEWTYQIEVGSETFVATLSGEFIENNDTQWTMKISQVGSFADVIWYTGIVSSDLRTASWTVYHQPQDPEPLIGIDYQYDETSDEFTIRYTNIIPAGPDNGHYIEYRTQPGAEFNRSYDVYRGSNDDFLEIQWINPSFEGRVRHPAKFGDDAWHCWDTSKRDTAC